jgi:16S rRNA (guanine527-N7)-methyltransferase
VPIDYAAFAQTIMDACADMGVSMPAGARDPLDRFVQYDQMLRDENTRQNLTRDLDAPDFIQRLYLDSLTPLAVLNAVLPKQQDQSASGTSLRAVDIGSGAGFPGIPLAIMRDDITFTLLDSLGKRCQFLRRVVDKLGLNAHAAHARAEDFARDVSRRGKYDIAFSRAVAPLSALMELSAPCLMAGGRMIAHKGPAVAREYDAARKAAVILNMSLDDPIPASAPGSATDHVLVVARQIYRCPDAYPRQAGTPARSPLGA